MDVTGEGPFEISNPIGVVAISNFYDMIKVPVLYKSSSGKWQITLVYGGGFYATGNFKSRIFYLED